MLQRLESINKGRGNEREPEKGWLKDMRKTK
jgi:hypothetical protein